MNKNIKTSFYLNTLYWTVFGIFEGIGFFPGITLKVARARGLPEWDPEVISQYWGYLMKNTAPKYLILWVLGYGVALLFQYLKGFSRTKFALLMILGSVIHAILQSILNQWLGISNGLDLISLFQIGVAPFVLFTALLNTNVTYWLFVVALLAFDYFQRYQEERVVNLELSNSLNQSKLESLVYQLRPHFLFNAMNAISMLIRANKNEKAVEVISDLSELLRNSLKEEKRSLIPLREEIMHTRKYLALEEKLYSDSLEVSISIDKETEKFMVPHLILQPIIENAFKHGLSKITSKGTLKISSSFKNNKAFYLQVQNSGPQLVSDWELEKNKGIGLSNVISRLENLYTSDSYFTIKNDDSNGIVVTICIPILK